MTKLTILDHVHNADGSTDISYYLPERDRFDKVILKVEGRSKSFSEPETYGTVRTLLPEGSTVRVRMEAVGHQGQNWSISDEVDIRRPRNEVMRPTKSLALDLQKFGRAFRKPPTHRGFASIGLHNPKTPENVGGVIRAAQAYGAASVAISGQRIDGRHIAHVTNTARGDKHIPIYRGELRDLIPYGAVPVAVELVDDAESLFTFQHPRSAFYIFGPEDSGLGQSIREWCKHTVMIPTSICLNLASCVGTVLYDRAMKESQRL